MHRFLGGGFLFLPLFGEDSRFDKYVSKGLKPSSRFVCVHVRIYRWNYIHTLFKNLGYMYVVLCLFKNISIFLILPPFFTSAKTQPFRTVQTSPKRAQRFFQLWEDLHGDSVRPELISYNAATRWLQWWKFQRCSIFIVNSWPIFFKIGWKYQLDGILRQNYSRYWYSLRMAPYHNSRSLNKGF